MAAALREHVKRSGMGPGVLANSGIGVSGNGRGMLPWNSPDAEDHSNAGTGDWAGRVLCSVGAGGTGVAGSGCSRRRARQLLVRGQGCMFHVPVQLVSRNISALSL